MRNERWCAHCADSSVAPTLSVSQTLCSLAFVGLFSVEPFARLMLGTVALLDEPPPLVAVVTRDRRARDNAQALGYAVE
jgi:hypothetical protein